MCTFTEISPIVDAQLFSDKFIYRVRVEDGTDSFIIAQTTTHTPTWGQGQAFRLGLTAPQCLPAAFIKATGMKKNPSASCI